MEAAKFPVAPSFKPSAMQAFIRSHRYHSGGSHCVMDDLLSTVHSDAELRNASLMLIGSDNGGGYTLDSAFNIHILGRLWRSTRKAMLLSGAFHAGGSRFNYEIEFSGASPGASWQAWSWARARSRTVTILWPALLKLRTPLRTSLTQACGKCFPCSALAPRAVGRGV